MNQTDKMIKTGIHLKDTRNNMLLSLSQVAELTNIQPGFINAVENGTQVMSDAMIVAFAKVYDLDENKLFEELGRMPIKALKLLQSYIPLQYALARVRGNPDNERLLEEFIALIE